MASPEAVLLPIAESIADGADVDWGAVEAAATPDHRRIVRELRVLAELSTLHRTLGADGARTSAPEPRDSAPAIGRWAHLDLIARIGGGSFGDVYRAWDRHLQRQVALKLLRNIDAADDPFASRLVEEGRLLASVRHPNVVAVHGVAEHEGRVGLWMELIEGSTLEQVLSDHGPFSAAEAALVGVDLCRALAAIHRAGLVHRDVKTQNVVRERGGRIVLMDLGTGRRLDAAAGSDRAGTPLSLAPEIFEGAPASPRTDLYSLGVLLYRLVTGEFPVRAATMEALEAAHRAHRAIPLRDARPDLPGGFVRIVDRAIASNPDERYTSAGELERDLAHTVGPAEDTPHLSPAGGRSRLRHLAIAAVLILSVLGLIRLSMVRSGPAPAPGPVGSARTTLAVLPFTNLVASNRTDLPELIQTLFVNELTGTPEVAVIDPLSMNAMLANAFGSASPARSADLFRLVRQENASFVIDGTILEAGGGGFDLRINMYDPVSGQARLPGRAHVATDEMLPDAVRSLSRSIVSFLQLQGLPLASDRDLQPWISLRRQNIEAVNAFLQASQYIFRYERVAGERYVRRAIELDPTFVEPRVWLIPGLVGQNKLDEAQRHFDALKALEPNATPFEQAMIEYAGAIMRGDSAAAARQLEVALEFHPGNNILLVNLAEHREELGDCLGALDAMRPAVEMRWQFPPIYELWGSCSIRTGRVADARDALTLAIERPPVHPNVYAILEGIAVADGDDAAAARYHTLFAEGTRNLDRPPGTMGFVGKADAQLAADCYARGEYERAARLYAMAHEVEPAVAAYLDGQAEALTRLGRSREADRVRGEAQGIRR